MQTIVFASQKGGSGKTTLAAHMAVQACAAGFDSAAMIDTDPQCSLHGWWKMRQDATPALIRSSAGNLAEDLEKLRAQGHRLAMIDTQCVNVIQLVHAKQYYKALVGCRKLFPFEEERLNYVAS